MASSATGLLQAASAPNKINKTKGRRMKIMALGRKPTKVTRGEIAELEKSWNRYASPATAEVKERFGD